MNNKHYISYSAWNHFQSMLNIKHTNFKVVNSINLHIGKIVKAVEEIFNCEVECNTVMDHSFWLEFQVDNEHLIEINIDLEPANHKENNFSTSMQIELFRIFYDAETNHKNYKSILKNFLTITNDGFKYNPADMKITNKQLYDECIDLISEIDKLINIFINK